MSKWLRLEKTLFFARGCRDSRFPECGREALAAAGVELGGLVHSAVLSQTDGQFPATDFGKLLIKRPILVENFSHCKLRGEIMATNARE
jgi:hypothetical protein